MSKQDARFTPTSFARPFLSDSPPVDVGALAERLEAAAERMEQAATRQEAAAAAIEEQAALVHETAAPLLERLSQEAEKRAGGVTR